MQNSHHPNCSKNTIHRNEKCDCVFNGPEAKCKHGVHTLGKECKCIDKIDLPKVYEFSTAKHLEVRIELLKGVIKSLQKGEYCHPNYIQVVLGEAKWPVSFGEIGPLRDKLADFHKQSLNKKETERLVEAIDSLAVCSVGLYEALQEISQFGSTECDTVRNALERFKWVKQ